MKDQGFGASITMADVKEIRSGSDFLWVILIDVMGLKSNQLIEKS